MRKIAVAILSLVVVCLMLVPSGASAGTRTIVVEDRMGDLLGGNIDWDACEGTVFWQENTPVAQVGYFDITSFWLSEKGKMFTFGMEVAGPLPKEGSALPTGFHGLKWLMWIDPEPWNLKYNPIMSLYTIQLVYDGSAYAAELKDYATGEVLATLPYSIGGSRLEMQFSAASIGNLESFWFIPCTVVQWSQIPGAGYWDLDTTDPGAVPGQVWWDIPWPPV
jgi:hypothetical protein